MLLRSSPDTAQHLRCRAARSKVITLPINGFLRVACCNLLRLFLRLVRLLLRLHSVVSGTLAGSSAPCWSREPSGFLLI